MKYFIKNPPSITHTDITYNKVAEIILLRTAIKFTGFPTVTLTGINQSNFRLLNQLPVE